MPNIPLHGVQKSNEGCDSAHQRKGRTIISNSATKRLPVSVHIWVALGVPGSPRISFTTFSFPTPSLPRRAIVQEVPGLPFIISRNSSLVPSQPSTLNTTSPMATTQQSSLLSIIVMSIQDAEGDVSTDLALVATRAPRGPNLAVPGSVSRITETLCSSLLDVSWMSSPSTIPVHADISVTSTRDPGRVHLVKIQEKKKA